MAYPVLLKAYTLPPDEGSIPLPNAAHVITDWAPNFLHDDSQSGRAVLTITVKTWIDEATARAAINPATLNNVAPAKTRRYGFNRADARRCFGIAVNGTIGSVNPLREMYDLIRELPEFTGATETT